MKVTVGQGFLIVFLILGGIVGLVFLCIALSRVISNFRVACGKKTGSVYPYYILEKVVKIEFKNFLQWHSVAPSAWELNKDRIQHTAIKDDGKGRYYSKTEIKTYVCFGFGGYLAYRVWRVMFLKQEAQLEDAKRKVAFLENIQADIDKFKKIKLPGQ